MKMFSSWQTAEKLPENAINAVLMLFEILKPDESKLG